MIIPRLRDQIGRRLSITTRVPRSFEVFERFRFEIMGVYFHLHAQLEEGLVLKLIGLYAILLPEEELELLLGEATPLGAHLMLQVGFSLL